MSILTMSISFDIFKDVDKSLNWSLFMTDSKPENNKCDFYQENPWDEQDNKALLQQLIEINPDISFYLDEDGCGSNLSWGAVLKIKKAVQELSQTEPSLCIHVETGDKDFWKCIFHNGLCNIYEGVIEWTEASDTMKSIFDSDEEEAETLRPLT